MNVIEKINGYVYVDNSKIDKSMYSYINDLAIKNFKNIKSIIKSTKRITKKTRLNPIYISKDILLIPFYDIRSEDAICINYFNIKGITINAFNTTICFNDGMIRSFSISSYKMQNSIKKAILIDEYITLID